jgi:hypothetical protein
VHPASAFFTHAQLDFCAHSGTQPQAGPPFALSSQYQPVGQMASPQGVQVPSSQVARGGAGALVVASSSLSGASDFGALPACASGAVVADSAGLLEPPQAVASSAKTNQGTENAGVRGSRSRAADIEPGFLVRRGSSRK